MPTARQAPPPHLAPDNNDIKTTNVNPDRSAHAPDSEEAGQSQPQLALPAPGATAPTQQLHTSDSEDVKHTVRFDGLGPLVVNKDGTLSRIHNWAQMTDTERERTVRVLGKRNMIRKTVILKDE